MLDEIMQQLDEVNPAVRAHIRMILELLGPAVVQAMVTRALEHQAAGGMTRLDGQGNRTTGGIFFYLLRKHCTIRQRRSIWPQHYQPALPPLPPRTIGLARTIQASLQVPPERFPAMVRHIAYRGTTVSTLALQTTLTIQQAGGRLDRTGQHMAGLQVWYAELDRLTANTLHRPTIKKGIVNVSTMPSVDTGSNQGEVAVETAPTT